MMGNNVFGLLKDPFLPERVQVALLGTNHFGADLNNIVKTIPVFHRQTAKPTDE